MNNDNNTPKNIQIVALTKAGLRLATSLHTQLPGSDVLMRPKPFADTVQALFRDGHPLLLICATGIAVRTLAPVLAGKLQDPPVLVLDEQGAFVIPLLSGHEGGANDWGLQVSELTGGQLAMTTAKPYLKPVYSVGLGCERGCPADELRRLLDDCLAKAGLTIEQISALCSIDIKADEVGMIELAASLDKPFETWSAEQLLSVDHLLSSRSEYIFKTVGVYGVAESAALFGGQQRTAAEAELVLDKHKTKKATCAIARSYPKLKVKNTSERA